MLTSLLNQSAERTDGLTRASYWRESKTGLTI